MLFIQSMDTFV